MTTLTPRRALLASRLRAVRVVAFASGQQLADHVGWQQSRVSKLETGAQFPTEADIATWVQATRAGTETHEELLALLAAARIEYTTHRDESRKPGGLASLQARIGAAESQVRGIRQWHPAMVLGLLQTAAYARELLTGPLGMSHPEHGAAQVEALVAERIRRQEILYQPGRRIELIISEAALCSAPGSVDTLLGQLDRLVALAGLTTVEIGVVAFPAMPVAPLSGFVLHDDTVAFVETLTGTQQLDDPDEVAVYVAAFERLRAAALYGDDAVAVIRRAMTRLRPS